MGDGPATFEDKKVTVTVRLENPDGTGVQEYSHADVRPVCIGCTGMPVVPPLDLDRILKLATPHSEEDCDLPE
jgi:hypothetical protein